jgi:hypothetical protein
MNQLARAISGITEGKEENLSSLSSQDQTTLAQLTDLLKLPPNDLASRLLEADSPSDWMVSSPDPSATSS